LWVGAGDGLCFAPVLEDDEGGVSVVFGGLACVCLGW
jgi:hypothetical protein